MGVRHAASAASTTTRPVPLIHVEVEEQPSRSDLTSLKEAIDINGEMPHDEHHEERPEEPTEPRFPPPPPRPYPRHVIQLVDRLMELSQAEADQLCQLLTEKMTPRPAASVSSKGKGKDKFEPKPVASRVPFPHPAGMFLGVRAPLALGMRPLTLPGVGAAIAAKGNLEQMAAMQANMAANPEAYATSGAAPPPAQPVAAAADDTEAASAEVYPSSGGAASASAAEEKPVVGLKLHKLGDASKKIAVIKEVRALTTMGLKESKELVESVPKMLKRGMAREEAQTWKEKLEALGAEVTLE
ncbi:unnamed protein product [Vitrella brassicaformis CCMP3155]|uniref:Large ribosomal subunit protein bL12 C-terminal domain-containing protein n=1 Tax=Vitrella brassicaformis (strain CCMP3155) TaxID=1169540 RepID=A0A0G4GB80_VITBC|nr:unnamed protein product [Vitrella brassicaformis CCMP3155]|eukprot:CEM26138.1 unnamed protein product [Vitrella brassicaformis CCMP3155]